jgi:hypothetical protein
VRCHPQQLVDDDRLLLLKRAQKDEALVLAGAREGLGETFTLELREAWAEAYYTLASVMIGAASGEAAA